MISLGFRNSLNRSGRGARCNLNISKDADTAGHTGLPPISRLALTRREFRDLISFARENLGTTLHLFGAGDYELIPPQLSGFKHLCLGTGPQALCPPGTSPPFRVNFIELPSPDGPPGDAEPRTRISLYRRRTPEATPEHRAYGADELRPWIYTPPAPPPLPDIHSLLQSRLRAKIDWKDSQLIWVYGLPGNGRFRPFEQEHPLLSPEGQPVPCFTQELKGSEEQAIQALQELKRQIREAAPRNQKIVVVIRDLLLDGMTPGTRDKYQDRIGKELTFLTRLKHTLFYISNALGETIDYDLELEGFYNKDTLICQPLDTVMMEALDAHYSHRLPLYRERVDYLSGRYAGLSLEIFEWAERVFKEWPGAEQIRPEACGILLTAALHPETANGSLPNAYLLAAHIYHTLTRTPIGVVVVKFIQSKVLQGKIDVNWLRAGAERKVVSFSRQEIFDEIPQENPLILNFLDSLVRHSILSQPTEDEYRVRAVAPFLIDLRWAPSLAAVQEPPKPKSRFLAFLSYRSVSSNEAHRIATILRKAYEGLGGLDLFLFEDVQRDPASIEERINRELLARRNLIILHEGGMSFGGDGWQEREIYFWRQTWGPREGAEAGISVYVKTSEITLPLSLANQNVLSLALANNETIFGHVEGRLIPEYGVEPGLRPQHGLGLSEAGRG